MDATDFVGSFRYRYSTDDYGRKILEAKVTLKNGESMNSRNLSIKMSKKSLYGETRQTLPH